MLRDAAPQLNFVGALAFDGALNHVVGETRWMKREKRDLKALVETHLQNFISHQTTQSVRPLEIVFQVACFLSRIVHGCGC